MRSFWRSAPPPSPPPIISAHYGCQAGSLFIQHQSNALSANLHILLQNDDAFGSLTLTVHDTSSKGVATVCSIIKNNNETLSFRLSRSNEPAQSLEIRLTPTTLFKLSSAVKTHISQVIDSHHLLTLEAITKRAIYIAHQCHQLTCSLKSTITNDQVNHLLIRMTDLLEQETLDLLSLNLLDELNSETPKTCLK